MAAKAGKSWWASPVLWSGLVLLVIFFLGMYNAPRNQVPFWFGALAAGIVILGGLRLHVVCGEDGRRSTSHLQFWIWTAVFGYTYVAFYVYRVHVLGVWTPITEIPYSVMLAMGFSAGTVVGAKGIVTHQINTQQKSDEANTSGPKTGGLLTDNSGNGDLLKAQMLFWTVVAVGIYFATANVSLKSANQGAKLDEFPQIDSALLVLMGLSSGSYLGQKLMITGTPVLQTVTPPTAKPGQTITMNGTSFGATANEAVLRLNGYTIHANPGADSWNDTTIVFNVPATNPAGGPWAPGQSTVVQIDLIVDGVSSGNDLDLTIQN